MFFNVRYVELGTKLNGYVSQFDKVVENLMSCGVNDMFVLCGDYNLADTVSWQRGPGVDDCEAVDVRGAIPNALLDAMSLCDLKQVNVIRNSISRTLDLFITNVQPSKVDITRSDDPLVREDGYHPALSVSANVLKLRLSAENRPSRVNFYKADYVKLEEEFSRIDWGDLFRGVDVDTAVIRFYDVLRPLIDGLPKTFVPSRDYPVFYSHELISLIRRKDAVRMEMKSAGDLASRSELKAKFCVLRKSVKSMIKVCFDDYVKDCEEKLKTNAKCFFSFTKSLKKTNSLPVTMRYIGDVATDRPSVCNLFAKYFNSVYNPSVLVVDEEVMDPFVHQETAQPAVLDMSFTPDDVERALKTFNENKVSSPDGVPMMFFMRLSLVLKLPLCFLFNLSLREKKFPSEWKLSFVSPIFKSGDKEDVSNYRPVSILCAVSKVFERLVFNKLFDEFRMNIHRSQHGFFKGRSTQTNLMEYVSMVADAIVDGGQVDTVYTDFAKAFDKVDHAILLRKLKCFGLSTDMVEWFSSYLQDRKQVVVVGGSKSDKFPPTSGVPQGSILGPFLFIIFINDLLTLLPSCSGFADDLKLYRSISSSYDCQLLQNDLGTVVKWCRSNKMVLNVAKCAVMSTSLANDKVIFPYAIDGEMLERVSSKKDLGIMMDDKLSFNQHVEHMVRSAYKTLGFIFRCGRFFSNESSLRLLYSSLVRSKLEYCSSVWNPCYVTAIQHIERVQKKFTRLVYFKFNIAQPRPPYYSRLKRLRLQSLETRRLVADEIVLHKLVHKRLDTTLSQQLSFHRPNRTTRQNAMFYLPTMVTNYQSNAPIYRVQRNHDVYFRNLDLMNPSISFNNLVKNSFDW